MEHEDTTPPLRPRFEGFIERLIAVGIIVGVLAMVTWFMNTFEPFSLEFIARAFPVLLEGAKLTVLATVLAYLGGMGLGFLVGWSKTSKNRVLKGIATGYAEAIRGTPLLIQILFLFFVLLVYVPQWSYRLFYTGLFALLINTSAYQSEIFRAGLQSVAAGQVEAAKAIGLSYWGSMRYVIVPQAFRVVVPPLTNEFIALLKSSSLLFFIGVHELTYEGRILTFGGRLLEVYALVIGIYLLVTLPMGKIVGWLERKFRIPGLGLQQEPVARRITGLSRRPSGA